MSRKKNRSRFTPTALAALCLLTAGKATAEDVTAEEVTAEQATTGAGAPQTPARKWMAEGLEARRNDDLLGARNAYQRSFNAYPSFDVAGNLGLVEMELRQYESAANHLAYCLRHFPTGENRDLKRLIEENLAEAKQHVGSVTFLVSDLRTVITLNDDELAPVATNQQEIFVSPGQHRVVARLNDRQAKVSFFVEKGANVEVELTLKEEESETSSAASGPSGASKAGDTRGGRRSEVPDVREARPSLVPAYVLGGISAATIGTSLVFRALSRSKQGDIEDMQFPDTSACAKSFTSDCAKLNNALRDERALSTASTTTLVLGSAAAAATIGYLTYVLTKEQPSIQTGVAVTERGGWVTLRGNF